MKSFKSLISAKKYILRSVEKGVWDHLETFPTFRISKFSCPYMGLEGHSIKDYYFSLK